MRVWIPIAMLAWLLLFAGGCAEKRLDAQIDDLRTQMAEMNRRLTDAHVRIEEMSNRVFLIQEQLAQVSAQDSGGPSRRLPVVKLVPGSTTPAAASGAMGDAQQLTSPENHVINQPDSGEPPILISNWPGSETPRAASPSSAPSGEDAERVAYEAALARHREGDFNGAITSFAEFLRRHPKGRYTDNAVFWTGVALFEQQEYALAVAEFDRVLENRRSPKAADALYHKGLSLMRSGRREAALGVWRELISRFPDHEATTRARQELNAP